MPQLVIIQKIFTDIRYMVHILKKRKKYYFDSPAGHNAIYPIMAYFGSIKSILWS